MSHKNPRSHKDEIDKIVDSIEKEESQESDNISDLEDAIETDTEFSEETEQGQDTIAPIEDAGSTEIKHGKTPYSKDIAINEDALRTNKRSVTTTKGKTDTPSDDSEKAE